MINKSDGGHLLPGLDPASEPTPWLRVLLVSFVIALVAVVLLTSFAWPAVNTSPHGISLILVGDGEIVERVTESLEERLPGKFVIRHIPSADKAKEMVAGAEVDGALIFMEYGGPRLIVASLASPPIAQLLKAMANGIAGRMSFASTASIIDLAPMPEGDPLGIGVAASLLPLFIVGMATGAGALLIMSGSSRKLLFCMFTPMLAAVGMVAILHGWLGAFSGNLLAEWATIAAGIAAVAFGLLGLGTLIGLASIYVIAVLMLLLGNPLSGASAGPAFVPEGWSAIGQALPPGATATAMRAVEAFGGAGATSAYWTLAIWIASGLALFTVGTIRLSRLTDAGQ